jgi:hypothetical protein
MSNVSSVFGVIEALQKIPGFNTSKNSYGRSWLLNNGELGVFAREIIKQYEEEKANEKAKAGEDV